MTEAYEIGISLALQDGVSAGIAIIRRDLAALDRAIASTAANLAHLRSNEVTASPQRPPPAPSPLAGSAAATAPPEPPATATASASPIAAEPAFPPPELVPAPASSGVTVQLASRASEGLAVPPAAAPNPRAPQPQTTTRLATPALNAPIQVSAAQARQAEPPPTRPAATVPQPLAQPAHSTHLQPAAQMPSQSAPQAPAARPAQGQIPTAPSRAAAASAAITPSLPMPSFRPALPEPSAIPPAWGSRDTPNKPLDARRQGEPAPKAPHSPAAPESLGIPQLNKAISPPPFPGAQSSFAPPPQSQQPMTLQGDVILDGARVGRWMTSTLARQAARPPAGPTGPDPRQTPLWSGQAQGF